MDKDLSNFWEAEEEISLPKTSIAETLKIGETLTVSEEPEEELHIDELLKYMLKKGASDLHLAARNHPILRIDGDIVRTTDYPILTGNQIDTLMYQIMTEPQKATFEKHNDLDFAYALPGYSRFRINILKQRGQTGAVIRAIPNIIKSVEALGLPEEINKFAFLPRGLVLVTGPTGSGKSTTLAAIIDKANSGRRSNIITIEDPIEFAHEDKASVVSQREVGTDTESFASALKHALRQDPDIILVGEMRDLETIQTAITAAETGHLVFGTLHTQSAAETISRIIDVFPDGSKEQIRQQLGSTVQAIICQTLLKSRKGKGRVAALEIMKGTNAIRNLIRKNQIAQIPSYIETNSGVGMISLDQSLEALVRAGKIRIDEAAEKATNVEEFYNKFGNEEEVRAIRRQEEADLKGFGGVK
jgi:twitching motility protein PilT